MRTHDQPQHAYQLFRQGFRRELRKLLFGTRYTRNTLCIDTTLAETRIRRDRNASGFAQRADSHMARVCLIAPRKSH